MKFRLREGNLVPVSEEFKLSEFELDCNTVRIFAYSSSERVNSQSKGLKRGSKHRARLGSGVYGACDLYAHENLMLSCPKN